MTSRPPDLATACRSPRISEPARPEALAASPALDPSAQQALDRLTRLAARLLRTPSALMLLVDADRQLFASSVGMAEPCARESSLLHACCRQVAASAGPLVLEDAREHPALPVTPAIPEPDVVAFVGVPLRTVEGHVHGSFGVIDARPRRWTADDVTTLEELARPATAEIELHLVRRRLAERTADLIDLVDGTAELVCATDAGGRLTFVNRAWRETLGYGEADLAALRPAELVAPEHRARYVETARRLVAGERVDDFEAVLLARDGRRVVCRGRAVPILQPGPDGPRCVGTRSYYRDVTPEHAAEARRTRLVGMLEATADFVGTAAPDGRIEFLNAAGRRLVGLELDTDVHALPATGFHPPATLERLVDEALPTAVREGRWSGEGALLGPDGEEIPVSMVVVAQPSLVPDEPPYFSAVMRDLRERVRAEAALRASEAEHRALLAALPLIVYRVKPHAPYAPLYVSPGVAALGYTHEEWLATPDTWLRVLHPDDRARVLAETERALTSDGAVDYEYRVVARDGTIRWIHDRGQFVRDAAGAPVAWQGIMLDVTAQRAAEDALRTSEIRFRAIFDGAGVGVSVLDDAGTILQVNEAFADYLGYDVEALVGRHAPSLSPVDDADVTRGPVGDLRAGRQTRVTVEKRFLHRDGQVRWAKLTLSRLALGEGRFGILGIATDVTEQRRAQAALERERAFLAATLESLSDGVVACDAEGRLVLFNRATREFHGLPEAPLPPERWAEHYSLLRADGATSLPPDEIPLWRAFRGEELRGVDMVIAPVDAPRRHVRVSGRPIRDAEGGMLGAVVAMHDVTAQDAAERALRDSEARQRELVEQVSDHAIFRLDAAGRVETWNAGAERLKGYAAAEVLGRPLDRFYPPESGGAPRAAALLAAAAREGRAEDEGWRLRRDGTRFWANVVITALRDERGALTGYAKVTRDRTEQHEATTRLAEREARLALIYNRATDLMFLMRAERDASGTVTAYRCESVNDAYVATTGLPRESLLERTATEVLPPEAAARALGRYAEAARTGEVQRYDECVDLETGRLTLETTLTPVLDDAGRCTHLLGVARDVSATRRAEAAVRASEARFRGVLEHLRAPAVQIDVTGRVTFVNEALLMLTGWSRAEALGVDWFAHFVPNGAIARVLFEESVRTGVVPIQHEGELLTRHGQPRTVAWDHVALRGPDNAFCGIASVGQDITERRALEARLAALSEHDELTGLLNRRGFNRMAQHAIRSAARSQRHDAVLYVDLDRFKPINDSYGHAAGDGALRAVADVIRATVRDADFGARLGGDEFAIFAVGLREGEGHVLAARLRANLEAHNAEATAAGRPFRIAFSVGVAEVEPGDDLASLLARGDAALYAQKLARRAGPEASPTGR